MDRYRNSVCLMTALYTAFKLTHDLIIHVTYHFQTCDLHIEYFIHFISVSVVQSTFNFELYITFLKKLPLFHSEF